MKSGRMQSGPKKEKNLVGSGPGQNFVFCFGSDRVRAEISFWARNKFFMFTLGRAGLGSDCSFCGPDPGMKNPACADLARVTLYNGLSSSLLMCEGLTNFGGGRGSKPLDPPLGTALPTTVR